MLAGALFMVYVLVYCVISVVADCLRFACIASSVGLLVVVLWILRLI